MRNPKINNSTDAGRIALCESWAEHIGMTFADKTYGLNTNVNYLNGSVYTYERWLERQRNEKTNHMPTGLYFDLIDGINLSETAYDHDNLKGASGTIVDGVSGITNAQIFSLLNSSTTSPASFINKLNQSSYVNGQNSNQAVNNLYNSY